jgi:hypothetical protein
MRHFVFFLLAVVVTLGAVPASAQVQPGAPGRAYRGLFGGGMTGLRQSLTVQATAGAGYSWRMLFGTSASQIGQPVHGTQIPVNSVFEHFGGSVNYSLQLSRVSIGASGGASTTIYPTIERPTYPAYHGSASASMPLWSGATFRVGGGAVRQSWYDLPWQAGGLGEEQIGPVVDPIMGLTGILNPHVESRIEAGVNQRITSRLSLNGDYGFNRSHSRTRLYDLKSQSFGAHLNFSLFRGLSLRAGYVESRHKFDPALDDYRVHNFDGGVDFNRAFSFTRGVTVTFSFGTSAVFYGDQVSYQLTGHAGLTRDIGRSWRATLLYDRRVSLDQAFGRPFGSDQLNLNFGGLINRRVRFNSAVGAMRAVSLFGSSYGYEQYFGRIGLMTALTRYVGVSTDYSYFAYRYDANLGLPFVTTARGDRNAIRVNVNMWAPLLAQGRRNVTR